MAMRSAISQCNALKESNSVKTKKKSCLDTFSNCKKAQDSAVEYTATCPAPISVVTSITTLAIPTTALTTAVTLPSASPTAAIPTTATPITSRPTTAMPPFASTSIATSVSTIGQSSNSTENLILEQPVSINSL